ncbi:MAG: S-layer homology domain-containing protein [Peptococcaceae bacterium]|nr:S-layer homology domain-containing protein [Peptococcaceae bacterium]
MKKFNRLVVCTAVSLLLLLSMGGLAFAQFSDVSGHWAETQISDWSERGFIKGYQAGQFKPDGEITRAEFITLVNKSFAYTASSSKAFNDVSASDWFAGEVGKAVAAGYISGYADGTLKPNNKISRQEAAVVVAKILDLATSDLSSINRFSDLSSIPQWSRGSVSAVVSNGMMNGYPDQTYRPTKSITRAEAVSTLDRALKSKAETVVYNSAGTFGPAEGIQTVEGNVTINVRDVVLQNMTITGNLLLAEGIGDGDVTLRNVTVKGNTQINGGGAHSVVLDNCTLATITVNREGVRVVASGTTTVNIVTLESGATLVEVTSTGEGFEQVTISQIIPADAHITLDGNFTQVTVASVVNVEVASTGSVESLTLNAAANITGTGTITTATINTSGATITQQPTTVNVAPSVTTNVAGQSVVNTTTQTTTTTTETPAGGGGGGGGGTATAAVSSIVVNVSSANSITDSTDPYTAYDFDAVGGSEVIEGIQVSVDGSNFIAAGQEKLDLAVNQEITMATLIGNGLGANGISLGNLRALLGADKEIIVTGYVSATSYTSKNISVTINIGSGAGSDVDEYVTVERSGLDISVTVNNGKETTLISDIDVMDVLDIWGNTLVEYKINGSPAESGLSITGEAAIKDKIELWTGIADYNNITLLDLVDATNNDGNPGNDGYLMIENADNGNTYTISVYMEV